MNRTLAAMLAIAGFVDLDEAGLEAAGRLRSRQRGQSRAAGSARRSFYGLAVATGNLERGTRAKSRGPYPQHLIDNCEAMRARNGAQ